MYFTAGMEESVRNGMGFFHRRGMMCICVCGTGDIDGKKEAKSHSALVIGRCEASAELAKARMSGPKIAKTLGRTAGAVAQKAMKLGVRFRSIERRA